FVTGLQFGVRFPVPTEGLAELNGTSVQQNLLAILNDVTAKLRLLLISATLKATGCPQQVSCCHSLGEWVLPWTKHLSLNSDFRSIRLITTVDPYCVKRLQLDRIGLVHDLIKIELHRDRVIVRGDKSHNFCA